MPKMALPGRINEGNGFKELLNRDLRGWENGRKGGRRERAHRVPDSYAASSVPFDLQYKYTEN
jgi:hypothetical protein